MKAAVLHAPRDLRIETSEPGDPGPGEVLVQMGAGGICGSDLHYFLHGGFGQVRLRQPMILGHEVAGTVAALGDGVSRLTPGQTVAINPSRPCAACAYCLEGLPNHCENMRFYGSAMPMPHVQGAFSEALVVTDSQCVVMGPQVPVSAAAFCEPLSCALHAVGRAGSLLGKRVLITGQGPIGALATAAARLAGASEIVTTDVQDAPLAASRAMGADRAINVSAEPDALPEYARGKGTFHVLVEASGSAEAVAAAVPTLRPRGTMVQLGVGGDIALPMSTLGARELELRGSFRFHDEFQWAAQHISDGRIDVSPLLSAVLPLDDAVSAFELAADRSRAMKVQLAFNGAV
jgi:L-idonate 5-dehydrogenase